MATEALGFELETGVLEALVAASRYAFLDRHVGLVDGHVWERAALSRRVFGTRDVLPAQFLGHVRERENGVADLSYIAAV